MIIFAISVAILVATLMFGLPLYASFIMVAALLAAYWDIGAYYCGMTVFKTLGSFSLLAVPLFLLLGTMMEESGLGGRFLSFLDAIFGRIKGGLGVATVFATMIFGAICGSSIATVATIGTVAISKMEKMGYPRNYITALVSCSGLLGQLIPPSLVIIVYALAMGQNVMVLFLATLVPGIIMGILFSIINVIICRRFNTVPHITGSFSNQVKLIGKTGYNASLGLIMPVLLLGGIYGGLFTPTEGAAVSCVYVLIICFFAYRTINLKSLKKILVNTGAIGAAILLAIVFVSLFSKLLVMHDIPNQVARAIVSLSDNKIIILLLVNVLLIGVGMLMDDISGALMTLPILMPLMTLLGVPMTQLAAILAVNLGCGLMTPPVAPNLYVGARISGLSISDFMGYTLVFLIFGGIPTILLVTYVPSISLWLPTLVFGAGSVH